LASTLAGRLGIEQVVDETLDLGERPGAARPGRKLLTLVVSALVAGDSIDDADVLRSGETQRVLGHRVMEPSTLGTFLRSFTFGHVRQLDRALRRSSAAPGQRGAGPGSAPLTIDLDPTIVEVAGHGKQGAGFGYTKRRGYHPILATRSETGEALHARMRKGAAQSRRGAERFVRELVLRLRRLAERATCRRAHPTVRLERVARLLPAYRLEGRAGRSALRPEEQPRRGRATPLEGALTPPAT
jgi:hypothetical protein